MNSYLYSIIINLFVMLTTALTASCVHGQLISQTMKISNIEFDRLEYQASHGQENARKKLEILCVKGLSYACIKLWMATDYGRNKVLLVKPCIELNSGEACLVLAKLPDEIRKDKHLPEVSCTMAINLLKDECVKGNADSCWIIGNEYFLHHDQPKPNEVLLVNPNYPPSNDCLEKDYRKAFLYYDKGCDHGAGKSCSGLASMYSNGQGIERNENKAQELSKQIHDSNVQLCKNKNEYACSSIGFELREKNPAESRKFYKMSCELGLKEDCESG